MCPACPRAAGRARAERWKFSRSPSSAARDTRPPMTSSPMTAARSQYLLDLLGQVPDPRKKRGRRHALSGLLAVGIATVCGFPAGGEYFRPHVAVCLGPLVLLGEHRADQADDGVAVREDADDVGPVAVLQERREVAAVPQLRDRQLDR